MVREMKREGNSAYSKEGGGNRGRGLQRSNVDGDILQSVRDGASSKVEEEVKRKEVVPPNQMKFRKGLGTINNIYVVNYLINRQVETKGGKLTALFVDLRAVYGGQGDIDKGNE